MSDAAAQKELFPYLFATWVFELHVAGMRADDPQIRESCDAIRAASERTAGERASEALVARVRELASSEEPDVVRAAAGKLYGSRIKVDLGEGDRNERASRIRKYQFSHQLPWLARIWERSDGKVVPSWLLVERVTDEVRAADPNPWNDVDETRHIPIADFLVLWELDGNTSIYLDEPRAPSGAS